MQTVWRSRERDPRASEAAQDGLQGKQGKPQDSHHDGDGKGGKQGNGLKGRLGDTPSGQGTLGPSPPVTKQTVNVLEQAYAMTARVSGAGSKEATSTLKQLEWV